MEEPKICRTRIAKASIFYHKKKALIFESGSIHPHWNRWGRSSLHLRYLWNQMVVFSVKPLFTIFVVSLTLLVVLTLLSPPNPFSQNRSSGEPSLYVCFTISIYIPKSFELGNWVYLIFSIFLFLIGYWSMIWWFAEGR